MTGWIPSPGWSSARADSVVARTKASAIIKTMGPLGEEEANEVEETTLSSCRLLFFELSTALATQWTMDRVEWEVIWLTLTLIWLDRAKTSSSSMSSFIHKMRGHHFSTNTSSYKEQKFHFFLSLFCRSRNRWSHKRKKELHTHTRSFLFMAMTSRLQPSRSRGTYR